MPNVIKGIKVGNELYKVDYENLENLPTGFLPSVSAADSGKFIRVNSNGEWSVTSINIAEGSSF